MYLINTLFSFKGSPLTNGHKRYICHGCKKRWCTVIDNDNSNSSCTKKQSSCTKKQLQQRDGYCTECRKEKDLQPQKNDNNNTSPLPTSPSDSSVVVSNVLSTPSTSHHALYKKDKRFSNPKHTNDIFIEELSSKKSTSIIKIIESTYQLSTNMSNNKFKSMDEAKEYFARKFSYMTQISAPQTNMFNFLCPTSCRNKSDIVDYPKYEKFHVDRDAITSIYDTNWLNDSAVNLVLTCLNFVSIKTTKKLDVPKFLYGSSFDGTKVRPDERIFPNIQAYMECDPGDETDEMIAKCNDDMKLWYSNEQKVKLSSILDAYSREKKIISNYITCINIWNHHWIMLKVNLINNENTPNVVSIDSKNGQDKEVLIYRLWFSKFFGLYLKEQTIEGITEIDYSLASMKLVLNVSVANVHDGKDSMIEQYPLTSNVIQRDDCNCGILSLIRCVEFFKDGSILRSGTSEQSLLNICTEYRLRLLSLIARIYECLNEEHYVKFEDHLYMRCGNYARKEDVFKFQLIHELFNFREIELELNDDDHADNEKCNANTIYETTTYGYVQKMIKDMQSKKKKKRREKRQLFDASETPKKAKLPVYKEHKKLTQSQSTKTIPDVLPTYSLQTYVLQTLINKRSIPAIDFSKHNIVLKLFDDNRKGYDQLSDKAKKKITFHPSDITDEIKQLFFNSYNVQEATSSHQIVWKANLDDIMRHFPTYCLYVVNKEEKAYELVGALIVEPYFFLHRKLSSIIHMFAMKKGKEVESDMKVLMHDIFMKEDMRQNNLFIVTSIGLRWFRSTEFLKNMGFKLDVISEGGLSGSIVAHANTMVISVSNLVQRTQQYKQYTFNNNMPIHGFITNFEKTFYRINDHGNLQFYTSTFKWTNATSKEEDLITRKIRKFASQTPFRIFSCTYSYGHREGHDMMYSREEKYILEPIPTQFQQKTYDRENSCTWLTVSMIIHMMNSVVAEKMIALYMSDYERFEWLGLTKVYRNFKSLGQETVQLILQSERFPYRLKKMKLSNDRRYIDILFDDNTKGLYLCCLEPHMGSSTHVVAIDCNNKLILDCEETHKLELTNENLNRCCGFNSGGIKSIHLCFTIIEVRRKKVKHEVEDNK